MIPNKSHQSIIPIIEHHVQRGTHIHSDGANVYKCLTQRGYNHHFVVHRENYVDPVTGTHTNYIENLWSLLKLKIKAIRGNQMEMLDGHIDEFIYRFNRKTEGKIFDLLMADIARFHPI